MPIPSDMSLDAPVPPPGSGLFGRCIGRLRAWRQKRRWVREMRDAAALGKLDDILEDIGMTRAELDELLAAPANAGRQFEMMAELEGVDLTRLRAGVVREAIKTCSHCASRGPCERWLRTGVWKYSGDPRCPNAALFRH
jgi:uncharacterized protein YjiS (DUF1127 family)